MRCIDVSEFQDIIDWDAVKKDGIEAVVIRAGYGRGNKDGYFHNNIIGASEAGLHIGIYWFSYAYNDDMARAEADYCYDLVNMYAESIDMPIFFDWEYDSMKYANGCVFIPTEDLLQQ